MIIYFFIKNYFYNFDDILFKKYSSKTKDKKRKCINNIKSF
jgi:hypothetical protein